MKYEGFHRFRDRKELRAWLAEHARSEKECWVVCSRAADAPTDALHYLDVVEEALCFGWIDSTCKNDGGVPLQRLSPRKKGSRWTELNKERCRRLEKQGLMTDAGREALPEMDERGFEIADEVLERLRADETVWRNFEALPPLYRRVRIDNIQRVKKKPELFENRLQKFIDNTRRNILYGDWNDKGKLLSY
ncbi:MAG: YdeI/OmpD-associated family protein [Alistipes sp.]|nr:YdeI/OmpD-associated family protein [Alistipes sp.]